MPKPPRAKADFGALDKAVRTEAPLLKNAPRPFLQRPFLQRPFLQRPFLQRLSPTALSPTALCPTALSPAALSPSVNSCPVTAISGTGPFWKRTRDQGSRFEGPSKEAVQRAV
ncbi:hypothetical protein M885DRAFT_32802 [Pelagophyceae sp. CCMP2097]|nr:hypothetical protein M885DRAFT_32802 [Pelagophyceae sp. CCMP2097]